MSSDRKSARLDLAVREVWKLDADWVHFKNKLMDSVESGNLDDVLLAVEIVQIALGVYDTIRFRPDDQEHVLGMLRAIRGRDGVAP